MQQVHGVAIISDGGLSRMMAWSHFMSFRFAVLSVGDRVWREICAMIAVH